METDMNTAVQMPSALFIPYLQIFHMVFGNILAFLTNGIKKDNSWLGEQAKYKLCILMKKQ